MIQTGVLLTTIQLLLILFKPQNSIEGIQEDSF